MFTGPEVTGRCEPKNGIKPFDKLVGYVMAQLPYREARRVFWVLDNGTAHRGPRCATRLQAKYPNVVVVHGPVHASWLNQIEIYFSILQRKALTPNDFSHPLRPWQNACSTSNVTTKPLLNRLNGDSLARI